MSRRKGSPASARVRDLRDPLAEYVAAVAGLQAAQAAADAALERLVRSQRRQGLSWDAIARPLNRTGEGLRQRFGP